MKHPVWHYDSKLTKFAFLSLVNYKRNLSQFFIQPNLKPEFSQKQKNIWKFPHVLVGFFLESLQENIERYITNKNVMFNKANLK